MVARLVAGTCVAAVVASRRETAAAAARSRRRFAGGGPGLGLRAGATRCQLGAAFGSRQHGCASGRPHSTTRPRTWPCIAEERHRRDDRPCLICSDGISLGARTAVSPGGAGQSGGARTVARFRRRPEARKEERRLTTKAVEARGKGSVVTGRAAATISVWYRPHTTCFAAPRYRPTRRGLRASSVSVSAPEAKQHSATRDASLSHARPKQTTAARCSG